LATLAALAQQDARTRVGRPQTRPNLGRGRARGRGRGRATRGSRGRGNGGGSRASRGRGRVGRTAHVGRSFSVLDPVPEDPGDVQCCIEVPVDVDLPSSALQTVTHLLPASRAPRTRGSEGGGGQGVHWCQYPLRHTVGRQGWHPMNKSFYEASARAAARTGRAQGALRLQGSKAHKAHTCSTPAGAPGRNGRSTCLCETR